ncbi:MAG: hypothetical protein CUN56_08235 [Phototrophicales bacterium]|nr:MAG: hypothetical protein CUN56_08235 [Phototrophicales bacterium]RMG71586.1 MAG: GAF domain-containing sensor histidine kinase [Chloroflexota bacterium]
MSDTTITLGRLKDIVSIVMYAASADTLEEVLQRIAHVTRELVGCKYTALGIPDGQGGLRYFKVSGITPEEIEQIDHPPIGVGLLGEVMNERTPIRLEDICQHPKSVGFPKGHPEMKTFLGVPVQAGEQLFGMLYMTDKTNGELFTLADQWLVETIAGYAALAIAGTELRQKQTRITLLEERQRISMELHDGVIQSLYALGMHLDLLRHQQPDPLKFQPVIDGLNTVIEEIRSYILNLRQLNKETRTCEDIIYDVVSRLYIPLDVKVKIRAPRVPLSFSAEEVDSIGMIIREVLSNAVRHAEATKIEARCWFKDNHLLIDIHDDGKGFDPQALPDEKGLGLRNLQHRVQMHNGTLTIESQPGQGTNVAIQIPLPAKEHDTA